MRDRYPRFHASPSSQQLGVVERRPVACGSGRFRCIPMSGDDRVGDDASVSTGLDDVRRTIADDVATRVHIRDRGLEGCRIHLEIPGRVQLHVLVAEQRQVRALTDGDDQGIELDLALRSGDSLGSPAARIVGLAEAHHRHLDRAQMAVGRDDAVRRHQLLELSTFLEQIEELLFLGRHFGAGPAVEDRDLAVGESACCPRAVHRDIAAADHADLLPQRRGLPSRAARRKVEAVEDAMALLAFDPETKTVAGADSDHDRRKTLGAERLEGDVATYLLVMADLHTEGAEMIEVAVDGVGRGSVVGDGGRHHAAARRPRLEDRDRDAGAGEEGGGAEPARATADHRDFRGGRCRA